MLRIVQIRELKDKLINTGFFSVVISNVLAKTCALLGGIILVRILSKLDYGCYTKVMNNYSMLFIFNDFGCNMAMMQYRSENYNNKTLRNAYFVEPYKMAVFFSVLSCIVMLLSPFFYPYKSVEDAKLTQSLFLSPLLTTTVAFLVSNFRVLTDNKKYAIVNFAQVFYQYFLLIICSIIWNVKGAVLSFYLVQIFTIITAVVISKGALDFDWKAHVLSPKEKIDFLKFSLSAQFNSSISSLLHLFDLFLIGLIVSDNEILAGYKVAATIPQALVFIPNSIIIYIAPYFARKINEKKWIQDKTKKLLIGCLLINGIITLMGILSANTFFPLIFGKKYSDVVPCFIILLVTFLFTGSFQIPAANVIFTQHKVKINIIITLISNVANCILDFVLISNYGAIGAAVATCLVSVISSIVSMIFLHFTVFGIVND